VVTNNVEEPVTEEFPQFHLYWVKGHLESRNKCFMHSYDRLTQLERDDYDHIFAYVVSFPPCTLVKKEGITILDVKKKPKTKYRYINIYSLVKCENYEVRGF